MRIFEIFKEFKGYRRYLKALDLVMTHELWDRYKFSRGWVGQIGAVIRVNKMDIAGNLNVDPDVEKFYIVEYLRPFIDVLQSAGITSDAIKVDIQGRFGVDEIALSSKFLFYNVSFRFLFKKFKLSYILSRLLFLTVIIWCLSHQQIIFNYFSRGLEWLKV